MHSSPSQPPVGGSGSQPITQLLARARGGDERARDALLEAAYGQLRELASRYLEDERCDHTLEATALVHEAYLRVLQNEALPGENRAQFFAYFARAMRHILISHARARGRNKRGGKRVRVELDETLIVRTEPAVDLLALDDCLHRLAEIHPRKSQVVELRYFGGLSVAETASALDISIATVERDWQVARLWLHREMHKDE